MKEPRSGTLRLRRAEQLAALASPLRMSIVETLSLRGSLTVTDLAQALGTPRLSLYYQVRKLAGAGLVRLRIRKRTRGRPEAMVELARSKLKLDGKLQGALVRNLLTKTGVVALKSTLRNLRRTGGRTDLLHAGPLRNLLVKRLVLRLTPDELEVLNQLIDSFLESGARVGTGRGKACYEFTLVMSPCANA